MSVNSSTSTEKTSVIICGGGPTGALLSAKLGKLGVPNVVLEREPDITTDPRGIALDEEGVRLLQSIGAYDRIFTEAALCTQWFHFVSGTGTDLMKPPLLSIDESTSGGGTGHVGFICHKQPMLERFMRDAIASSKSSELKSSCKVVSISEDAEKVYVDYVDETGSEKRIEGDFLVGADGKTGFVRKKYLEPKGILMELSEGCNYDETWVALNWHMTLPTEKTHPEFPLWKLGYSPQQVYDLFFPPEFRFLCNPKRPAVCGRFGRPDDRLWRFEFVVQPGEDGKKMATLEETNKIIHPYITHPGRRYGLSTPLRYPEDCIKCLRASPFHFSARSCNKWALGRVILAGDAAHVFPPFGGQGIASGFRDVSALSWRLALLHRDPKLNHTPLLSAWYGERKQQLERSLATTVFNGAYVTESNPIKCLIREWTLWGMQLIPSWKRQLQRGTSETKMIRYKYEEGYPFLPDFVGGRTLPQVYAADLTNNEDVTFTDNLIFHKDKKGLLQLVVLPDSVNEIEDDLQSLNDTFAQVPTDDLLIVSETTFLVQDLTATSSSISNLTAKHPDPKIGRVASGAEFAALTETLCKNRPPPQLYDPFRIKRELEGRKYIIVRPDFFVYAACKDIAELKEAMQRIPEVLGTV